MAIKKTTKIKVSEKTVAQLRKGTMAGNLAKAKGATPEMKEALTRFYGASRVNAAIGKSGPGSVGKPKPMTPTPNSRENRAAPSVGTANDRENRKAAVTTPRGGPGAKMGSVKRAVQPAIKGAKPTATKRVNKPLVNLPGAFGNAQTKLNTKSAATKTLLAEQKKKAQANAKKNEMK